MVRVDFMTNSCHNYIWKHIKYQTRMKLNWSVRYFQITVPSQYCIPVYYSRQLYIMVSVGEMLNAAQFYDFSVTNKTGYSICNRVLHFLRRWKASLYNTFPVFMGSENVRITNKLSLSEQAVRLVTINWFTVTVR